MSDGWTYPERLDGLLAHAAERRPEAGIAILDRRGNADRRTYPELRDAVEARAGKLAARGLSHGDVLLVSLDTCFEWIECWLGAVRLGALPVAVAPAGAMGSGRAHLDKVDGLVERLDVKLVVAGETLAKEAAEHGLRRVADRHTTPAQLDALDPQPFEDPIVVPGDVAFLQLTSGSTGSPRGVAIRHLSAIHNVAAIDEAIGMDRTDDRGDEPHGVSWLPLHHDMGMVGCLLYCIAHAYSLDLIPSRQFLARPETWLTAIARRRRVMSPAPNFAYQACVERGTAEKLDGLSLAGWQVGFTGAEMVRPDTMRAFAEMHASLGYDPRTVRPCYGLAEGTLAVTFDRGGEGVRAKAVPGDDAAAPVACVGAPVRDTRVRITDEHGADLPEGVVGQVRVAGPGVFAGYWNDPEATAECLEGGELLTGDLGFFDGGELYITGRTKDVLIVRGSNLMPHELEWSAEAAVGGGGTLRAGAFSVDGGTRGEVPVLVVETSATDRDELVAQEREVRVRVGREVGLTLEDVALVRRGRLPKTSSGKVQRRELRRRYLAGELERLLPAAPAEESTS